MKLLLALVSLSWSAGLQSWTPPIKPASAPSVAAISGFLRSAESQGARERHPQLARLLDKLSDPARAPMFAGPLAEQLKGGAITSESFEAAFAASGAELNRLIDARAAELLAAAQAGDVDPKEFLVAAYQLAMVADAFAPYRKDSRAVRVVRKLALETRNSQTMKAAQRIASGFLSQNPSLVAAKAEAKRAPTLAPAKPVAESPAPARFSNYREFEAYAARNPNNARAAAVAMLRGSDEKRLDLLQSALDAAARRDDAETLDLLIHVLGKQRDMFLRREAARLIGLRADKAPEERRAAAVAALTAALNDTTYRRPTETVSLGAMAAHALRQLGVEPQAVLPVEPEPQHRSDLLAAEPTEAEVKERANFYLEKIRFRLPATPPRWLMGLWIFVGGFMGFVLSGLAAPFIQPVPWFVVFAGATAYFVFSMRRKYVAQAAERNAAADEAERRLGFPVSASMTPTTPEEDAEAKAQYKRYLHYVREELRREKRHGTDPNPPR